MPDFSNDPQFHEPRTEMLELDRAESLQMLATGDLGRVVAAAPHGDPVVRPVNYTFDARSQSIIFRTGLGSKLHALLTSHRAWFEVDGVDPANRTGWSVIVAGPCEEIEAPAELARLHDRGPHPWAPGAKYHWIRIRANTVTGRRIVLSAEHAPGYRA